MKKNMQELLEKYWEGGTSLEEERFIRSYFRSDNIDPEHVQYKPLFNFYDQESQKVYQLNKANEMPSKRRYGMPLIRMAAAILIVLGLSSIIYLNLGRNEMENDAWAQYEVQDPEKAKEMAMEALVFMSNKLNEGEENMRNNLKTLNRLPIR